MATLDADVGDLTVVYVETLARATEWLDSDRRIDAVVSEVDLPDGSGSELLELVRARDPDIPVVQLTPNSSLACEQAASDDEATVMTSDESTTPAELRTRLERAVGRYWTRRDRRIQRRLLQTQWRLLQALVVAVPDPIIVADESKTIVFANPAVADTLGYPPMDLTGRSLTALFPDAEVQQHLDGVERDLNADERPVHRECVETTARHGDGRELQLNLSIGGFSHDGRRYFVTAARDAVDRDADHQRRAFDIETLSDRLIQLDRIVEELLLISQVIVQADTREQLEYGVCRELIGSRRIAFAWIGEIDDGGEIQTRASTGHDREYLDVVSGCDESDPEPAVQTFHDRESTVIDDVSSGPGRGAWREAARERGIRSIVSVPLLEGDRHHGTLTVYATVPGAFDELDQRVLQGIADTIAYGIGALERELALIADSVVELQLELCGGDDIFSRLARDTGAAIELDGVVPCEDSILLFLVVTDAPIDDVAATLEADPAIGRGNHVEREQGDRFEVTVESEPLFTKLIHAGARMEAVTAGSDGTRVRVSLPVDADVGVVIKNLTAEYDEVTLLSRTDRSRKFTDERGFYSQLERRLTDRQLETLRTAFLSGYFEWPREQTSEEVAELLGISQPTFNHHLRIAERKLLSLLFDFESE